MKNFLKLFCGWAIVLLFRLIPFRIPNVEPILSVQMPFAKKFGGLTAFIFGFLSIAIYDIFVPVNTEILLVTGITYGLLGVFASWFFKHRESKRTNYVLFAIIATIVYDLITGVFIAPLFGQSLVQAFILQIPFTINHLLGNIAFSIVVSPLVYKWVVNNKKLELSPIFT